MVNNLISFMESKKTRLKCTMKWIMWRKRNMSKMSKMELVINIKVIKILTEVLLISKINTTHQQEVEMGETLVRPIRISYSRCYIKVSKQVVMFLYQQRTIIWQWRRRRRWISVEFRKTSKSVALIKKCVSERPRRKEKQRNWMGAHLRLS